MGMSAFLDTHGYSQSRSSHGPSSACSVSVSHASGLYGPSSAASVSVSNSVGGYGPQQCSADGVVRGHLGGPVLSVVATAPQAELAGGAGGVAAGQVAADAEAPQEPGRGPAAPAQQQGGGQHPQRHVESQQGHRGRGDCRGGWAGDMKAGSLHPAHSLKNFTQLHTSPTHNDDHD